MRAPHIVPPANDAAVKRRRVPIERTRAERILTPETLAWPFERRHARERKCERPLRSALRARTLIVVGRRETGLIVSLRAQ